MTGSLALAPGPGLLRDEPGGGPGGDRLSITDGNPIPRSIFPIYSQNAEYLRPGFWLVARPGALILLLGSVRVAAGPTRRLLIVHGRFMPSFPDAAGDGR